MTIGSEWIWSFTIGKLHCLVLIDLKVNDFSYADAGQMNMYLNYAKKHWSEEGENPPIGLILCTGEKKTLAKYTLEGMSNKILTAEYRTQLPSPQLLTQEIKKIKKNLQRIYRKSDTGQMKEKCQIKYRILQFK